MRYFFVIFLFAFLFPTLVRAESDPSGDFTSCASGETWQEAIPRWADLVWFEDLGESSEGYRFQIKSSDNFMTGVSKERTPHFSINLDFGNGLENYSVSAVYNGIQNKWSKTLLKKIGGAAVEATDLDAGIYLNRDTVDFVIREPALTKDTLWGAEVVYNFACDKSNNYMTSPIKGGKAEPYLPKDAVVLRSPDSLNSKNQENNSLSWKKAGVALALITGVASVFFAFYRFILGK